MTKKYKGFINDYLNAHHLEWQEFTSDNEEDATPEATGYERVVELETGKEIKNK
jgi:hypothetical protein